MDVQVAILPLLITELKEPVEIKAKKYPIPQTKTEAVKEKLLKWEKWPTL